MSKFLELLKCFLFGSASAADAEPKIEPLDPEQYDDLWRTIGGEA